jgi:hypothetical protein
LATGGEGVARFSLVGGAMGPPAIKEKPMIRVAAALLATGLTLGAAPAFAHGVRLDARQCLDLREDHRDARESRRDERIDRSRADVREDRADRRESRRDRAVTVCPRRAYHRG